MEPSGPSKKWLRMTTDPVWARITEKRPFLRSVCLIFGGGFYWICFHISPFPSTPILARPRHLGAILSASLEVSYVHPCRSLQKSLKSSILSRAIIVGHFSHQLSNPSVTHFSWMQPKTFMQKKSHAGSRNRPNDFVSTSQPFQQRRHPLDSWTAIKEGWPKQMSANIVFSSIFPLTLTMHFK